MDGIGLGRERWRGSHSGVGTNNRGVEVCAGVGQLEWPVTGEVEGAGGQWRVPLAQTS